ncbi:MAG: hypothetical protein IT210_24800 [Armatimonadetes bacterium]|nr:hypothetical protein [Armatimonadota bacterium]
MSSVAGEKVSVQVDMSRSLHPVSRHLFGGFVEHMYNCVEEGLWGEGLKDRKLAGAVPEGAALPAPWKPVGSGVSLEAPRRADIENNRARSVRLEGEDGILQENIEIEPGWIQAGSFWLKGEGTVRLRLLDGKGHTLDEGMAEAAPEWKRHTFQLNTGRDAGRIDCEFRHEGTGAAWIDAPSLMPASARGGIHPQAMKAVRALRLGYLRYPGGNFAQTYRWKDGIGPRDDRPARPNVAWQNLPETNDFGIDEYIALCRALKAEPTVCVNVDGLGATPGEAAEWVSYCNAPRSHPMGKLRAANGHPRPYNIRCWELGNEIYGNWEVGHSDAATYARNFLKYARAMKAADPSIRLVAVGESPQWNRTVLEAAGQEIDILSLHCYVNRPDVADLWAEADRYERALQETRRLIAECAPGRKITLSINEWNTMMPDPTQWTLKAAVFGGSLVNAFVRQGDLVEQACCSDLINGWTGGLIQRRGQKLFLTPNALVLSAYARTMGEVAFSARVQGPAFHAPGFDEDFPVVDAAATGSQDGKSLSLWIVNRSPDRSIEATIKIDGWGAITEGRQWTITARAPDAANDFDHPTAVKPAEEKWSARSNPTEFSLSPRSVMVIELKGR